MKAIEVNSVSKRYGRAEVLADVSFSVEKGAICGFVGRNGAGKTTMLRILTGLQKADAGTCVFPSDGDKSGKKHIGAIVESPALYYEMSAEENMRHLFQLRGRTDYDRIGELFRLVGLEETGRKKVAHFSLGMKQKLGLAMALEGEPEIVVLDEPMNGLDPQGMVYLRELILKLNREKGITFLISSHILEELSKIATQYVFIEKGRIVCKMTADELRKECGTTLCLQVSEMSAAEAALEQNGICYEEIGQNTLRITGQRTVTDYVMLLKEHHCDVLRCYEEEGTLEEFFVRLVGEGV